MLQSAFMVIFLCIQSSLILFLIAVFKNIISPMKVYQTQIKKINSKELTVDIFNARIIKKEGENKWKKVMIEELHL